MAGAAIKSQHLALPKERKGTKSNKRETDAGRTIAMTRNQKAVLCAVCLIGVGFYVYELTYRPPQDRRIALLIDTINQNPPLFHPEHTESVNELVAIGMPALNQTLDAVVSGDDDTRYRALAAMKLILRNHFVAEHVRNGSAEKGYAEWHRFLNTINLNANDEKSDRYWKCAKIRAWAWNKR